MPEEQGNGVGALPEEVVTAQSLAYAAVTARMAGDEEQVAECIYEALQNPLVAASAMMALLHTTYGLVGLAATANKITREELWQRYAHEVAWEAIAKERFRKSDA